MRCLVDPSAPDVFGQGWFGRHGLGFPAWWALILVEEAAGRVPESDLVACAGDLPVERLVHHRLVTIRDGYCLRGPAKLTDVAIGLGLLGSNRLRMAQHAVERVRQGGHDLEAYVNVRACRAFCFTYAPDEDAIGGLIRKLHFPYDSITEVQRVTGVGR